MADQPTTPEPDGPIPRSWFYALKGATRDLMEQVGTLDRCRRISGRSITALQRYHSNAHLDLMPVVVAIALQRECGSTVFTDMMVTLSTKGDSDDDGPGFVEAHLGLSGAALAMHHTFAEAASDGVISNNEKEEGRRKIAAVRQQCDAVEEALDRSLDDPIVIFQRRSAR